METIRTRQCVYFGERVGKCRDWFFEQVKDRPMGSVSKRLRQFFDFIPGPVREVKNRSLTNSPRLRQFPACKSTAFPRV